MRKTILIMMLLAGINGQDYAQSVKDINSVFEVQSNPFHRRYIFNLGKGDKMQVEVYTPDELPYLQNIDSIINVFIKDIEPLKDSLDREIYSRTIEYSIDAANLKRIALSKHGGVTSNFVIANGDLSLLKIEQDTVIINGLIPGQSSRRIFQKEPVPHYYRISFFLNDLNELSIYKDHMNEKMRILINSIKEKWRKGNNGLFHLQEHPAIEAPTARGYNGGGNLISVRPSVDIQNYKNYFVPSLSSGLAIASNRNLIHRQYYLGHETHFMFRKNDAGKLDTYINAFIVISYGQGKINPYTKKNAHLYPFVSFGYLYRNRGNFYDKNTFRMGMAQFNLFGNYTKVEPCVYFTNFFRRVTPSLRITQHF